MMAYDPAARLLAPAADGFATGDAAVLLPIMAPRLQADCDPSGTLQLALWGSGTLGKIRFTPLAAPYRYGPNQLFARNGSLHVAQSAPALVLRGAKFRQAFPARRCAWWDSISAEDAKAKIGRAQDRRTIELKWGVILAEQRDDDLVLAVGSSLAEAETGLALSVETIVAEAAAYTARCDLAPNAEPLVRGMVLQGVHAALSSIRRNEKGEFAGLAAGQAYSAPARTYYRDGYWTLQPLLKLAPDAVREQIRLLARGIQPDGEAPSGVILTGPAQSTAWEEFRRHADRYKEEHLRPGDWWSDHFDSPLFFVLTIGDYVRETGDAAEFERQLPVIRAVMQRYFRLRGPAGLPLKPRNDRDWADNVFREGLVSYDLGLWVGALDVVAERAGALDPALARNCAEAATHARKTIDAELWVEARQGYADWKAPDGFVEDHLVLDSLTLLRYRAVPEARAKAMLRAMRATLESRHNDEQPYGDWGVLCAFPPFKRPRDVRAKSAFAFRYHNGSDWPYLDGLYAGELLRYGIGGARYALTRWWQACLDNGWAGAIEYYCPPFGRGSLLQGWSAMPAAVILEHGPAALAAIPEGGR